MLFSKNVLVLVLMLLVVLLQACATTDGKKLQKGDGDQSEQVETGEEGKIEPFVVIPSPYQPGDVPVQAQTEFKKIKALMDEQKWQQAKGQLELMVATYPALSGPYVNLGIVHHNLEEFDQAEKALLFAIETNPLNFDAYTRLGFLYREQGEFQKAEASYLDALTQWPHHLDSTINLGILYDLYMGRFDEALIYYELSQNIAGGEDRKLKGWIIDLTRRMKSQ